MQRYVDVVQSLAKRGPCEDQLTHFTMGMAREFGEYSEALLATNTEAKDKLTSICLELGDILFYNFALVLRIQEMVEIIVPNQHTYYRTMPEARIHWEEPDNYAAMLRATTDFDWPNTEPWTGSRVTYVGAFTKPLERVLKWRYHNAVLDLGALLSDLWHTQLLLKSFCFHNRLTLRAVAEQNAAKLLKRHPDGFRGIAWQNDPQIT